MDHHLIRVYRPPARAIQSQVSTVELAHKLEPTAFWPTREQLICLSLTEVVQAESLYMNFMHSFFGSVCHNIHL